MKSRKFQRSKFVTPEERQEQARQAREKQTRKLQELISQREKKARELEERRKAHPIRSVQRIIGGLNEIPLKQTGIDEKLHVSKPYRNLAELALNCMNLQERHVALCWPDCDPSPAALTSLIALAECTSCEPIEVDGFQALSAPLGIRALIFPYARTAHRALRHLYIDKEFVSRVHIQHQIRDRHQDDKPSLADYHRILARARSLPDRAKDGRIYEELINPCLDEIIPSGPCSGSSGRSEVLWRVGKKTDIKQLKRTGQADDPTSAAYYLFGLPSEVDIERKLSALPNNLDLIFLDLDYTGRNRLGQGWISKTRDFVKAVEARFESACILALTDDPWAYDIIRFEVFGKKQGKKRQRIPSPSSVVYFPRSDIAVSHDMPDPSYSNVGTWEVLGFSGSSEEILADLRKAARKARELNDRQGEQQLRDLGSRLRRCISLPGSLVQLGDYCTEEVGDSAATEWISSYRVEPIIADLRSSTRAYAQLHQAELLALCDRVQRVAENTNQLSPMALLLRDLVKKILRVSSRSVVVLPLDMLADFAVHVLTNDDEIGAVVADRIEKDMLVFTHKAGFMDIASMDSPKRNGFKRLALVAPSRSMLLEFLSWEWLCETVFVLADCDTLSGAARDTSRLANLPELSNLQKRMNGFTAAARRTVEEKTDTVVSFDQKIEPGEELDFPVGGIVNLAGAVSDGQSTIQFELDGGQVLVTKPNTKLVVQDRTRTIPTFAELEAHKVAVGHRVCVIGDAFLEMARPLLNISVRAAEEIRDYHALVLENFEQLSGRSPNEKLHTLVEKMGRPDVTTQRAGYWVDLDEQIEAPLHDVVPHAPRDFKTFISFMNALGIGETLSRRFWTWAVIAQRASRLRAAFSFHDAYRGILVETYAAQSDNPERAQEISQLRAAAENFVSVVRSKKEVQAKSVRT